MKKSFVLFLICVLSVVLSNAGAAEKAVPGGTFRSHAVGTAADDPALSLQSSGLSFGGLSLHAAGFCVSGSPFSSPFVNRVMNFFIVRPSATVAEARTWLIWLGVGVGVYALLCVLLWWLAGVFSDRGVFFVGWIAGMFTLAAPAVIPLAIMSYVYSNLNDGLAIWFMNDANGFGWIGFIIWCVVCVVGGTAVIDAVKSLFTFWRRNILLTLVQVVGGVAWIFTFGFMILAIMKEGNDFLILSILVTLAALSGGAYKSVTTPGTLMDYFGREIGGTFSANRFYGNDGNSYTRNTHGGWERD